jgi:hypothetical protein
MRKSKQLGPQAKRPERQTLEQMDRYSFASEIALQQISVEFGTTLDELLCDPRLAAHFDELAKSLSPGFSSFQYRWAALTIRKRAKRIKELARSRYGDWLKRRVPGYDQIETAFSKKFERPGVHILGGQTAEPYYIGQTCNLRARIELIAGIPSWKSLQPLSVRLIPSEDRAPIGLQSILVQRFRPLMNSRLLLGEA